MPARLVCYFRCARLSLRGGYVGAVVYVLGYFKRVFWRVLRECSVLGRETGRKGLERARNKFQKRLILLIRLDIVIYCKCRQFYL